MTTRIGLRAIAGDGGRSVMALGLLGRLPTAMMPLTVLLVLAGKTDSFAVAGSGVAVAGLGGAVSGPAVGALSERIGQRRVVGAISASQSVFLVMLLILQARPVSSSLLVAVAGLVGMANPAIGSMARAQWAMRAHRARDRRSYMTTAMGWEAAADEISFVVGPIGASVVTGWAGPTAALAVVTVLALPTQVAFAALPQPAVGRVRAASQHRRAMHRRLTTSAVAALPALPALGVVGAVGVVFGSTQSALAARFAATGDTELTGLVYGCVGVGSALGGVATTWLSPRIRLTTRMLGFGAALCVTSLLLLPSSPPWAQAGACLVIGANISPLLATAYVLAEHRAALGTATTVMSLLATSTAAGVGIGAASAGELLDAAFPLAALTLPVLSGLIALSCGLGALLSGERT